MERTVPRATELASKRAILAAFARTGSARVIAPVVAVLVTARVLAGGWGRGDVIVVLGLLVVAGPLEWWIHRTLLHASPDAWTSRRLGTGSGHREHHLDPPELRWLLLRTVDAAVFLVVLAVGAAAVAVPVALLAGGDPARATLTAVALTSAGLLHYEWTHLLVHTAYRPRTRSYARLARNHRRHHYRNERYWLGVTSNLGDRLLGTLPAADDDVPRSPTARSLAS